MAAFEGRRDAYRDLVLNAAEREFAGGGFAAAKMTAIAKGADLSLATVYKLFPSKLDIWNEVHAERMTALLAHVDERVTTTDSPMERLVAGVAAVAEFLAAHDAYLDVSLRAGSSWLTHGGATGVQATVWSSGLDTIAAGVESAAAAGELIGLRPRIAAGMIISALQVWLADWVESGRDRDAEELVADLVAHLRIILSPRPSRGD